MSLPTPARRYAIVLLLSIGLCGANAYKPLTVDDSVYYLFASHIASHPLDPYGFHVGPNHEPAIGVLAPPVLLYWWAGALALMGQSVLLWKCTLFPFCLTLVASLAHLARRFAPGREISLTSFIILLPAVLPCLNFMLDLPSLALGLAALTIFLSGCEKGGVWRVLAAGLLAGLALQTKYTAAVIPPLFLTAGLAYRRPLQGVIAAGLALLIFVGWEGLLVHLYGHSHFLLALRARPTNLSDKLKLILPLVGILGGTFAAAALIFLAGLRGRRWHGWVVVLLILVGYLAMALVPAASAAAILNPLVFGSLGLLATGLGCLVFARLVHEPEGRRETLLLLLWLVLEMLAYFALTPYQAVRRVIGMVVVGSLIGGRLLALQTPTARQRTLLRQAVGLSALTGILGFLVDLDLWRQEARAAREIVRTYGDQGRLWYQGMGGFEFMAARTGMRWLDEPGAVARPGDLLAVPLVRGGSPTETRPGPGWEYQASIHFAASLPLRSRYQYGGTALEHQEGPLMTVAVYRLRGMPLTARDR